MERAPRDQPVGAGGDRVVEQRAVHAITVEPEADARQGFTTLERHFPGGTISPVYVVVRDGRPILDDRRTDAIDDLTDALRAVPGIAEVRSLTQPAGQPLTPENLEALAGSADLSSLGLEPGDPVTQQLLTDLQRPEGLRLTASILRSAPGLQERLAPLIGQDGGSKPTGSGHGLAGQVFARGSEYKRRFVKRVIRASNQDAFDPAASFLRGSVHAEAAHDFRSAGSNRVHASIMGVHLREGNGVGGTETEARAMTKSRLVAAPSLRGSATMPL